VGLSLFLASAAAAQTTQGESERYGFLNLLDHRSRYGESWFPEPLRAPEMDVDREFRVDWFHTEQTQANTDQVTAEMEYNFGLLTLEAEAHYLREQDGADFNQGVGNVELAARYPFYQYVTRDDFFDYTLAAGLELGIPTQSEVSHDTEIVPKLLQLMRFGEHFSVQSSLGYSSLIGPEEGGNGTLEYSVILGYAIEHDQLPLPGVQRVIPLLELIGETGVAGEENSATNLSGTAGVRINFNAIGEVQPRLGLGYAFPLNDVAREEMRWGVIVSMVFEF
jgi:hypothetical protein